MAERKPLRFNIEKAAEPPVEAPQPVVPASSSAKAIPAHRATRKVVQLWLQPEPYRQLKMMAVREDQTMQDLLEEALDDLFQKRGEHRITKA